MKFIEFTHVFGSPQVIDIRNVITYFNGLDRRRLYEWQKKGYLTKIANNFYILSGRKIDGNALRNIGCQIHAPAYIALESALTYYHFIPEAVFQTVSITTQRNRLFRTKCGDFRYRSIKPCLFFGYRVVAYDGGQFFISDPEKTLLDFLYFMPGSDRKKALSGMRFNVDEIRQTINTARLKGYLRLFASPKLTRAIDHLMELVNVEF